jgi:hypothetical protein
VLHYNVRRRPGQTVVFHDVAEGSAAKEIGRVSNPGRGTIKFAPAPGKGRGRIVAQFELQDLPAERRTVTSFRRPSPVLPRPRGLRVKRRKATLVVSWKRVAGATHYDVAATSGTGFQRFRTTKKRRLVLKVPKTVAGRLTVRAADRVRQSKPAGRHFKRLRAPSRKLKPLGHCKVKKRKVKCAKR